MSILDDLIMKVEDPVLRDRLKKEVHKATKHKQFGLVFEEHLPECTPLYDVPIKKGSRVAPRDTEIKTTYIVRSINGDDATCVSNDDKSEHVFNLSDIVVVAEFGEPIYPYLQTVDTVCNAPDSYLWHTLIEADNYHALQLLEYMYAGQVDCIYIDPPYNTKAKDWKYNNNYIDPEDIYKHSKWLSLIKKRLVIAKKLLSKTGIMITTIDDNEYAELLLLIKKIFPEFIHTTITIQMNPGGTQGKSFSVTNEFAIVSYRKESVICKKEHEGGDTYNIRRWGSTSNRYEGATCFYPVILDKGNNIIGFGDLLPKDMHPKAQVEVQPDGSKYVWPLDVSNNEKKWRYSRDTVEAEINRIFVKEGKNNRIEIMMRRETEAPKTIWINEEYNAESYGTKLLKKIIGPNDFPYPKSVYAEKDCIALAVRDNKNALILDFFAGSGTTLHAVNLLNADDGGQRRCILVTNNEVGDKTEKKLKARGLKAGDEEWEALGIARSATWPRTVCSIQGHDINGKPLKGSYLGSEKPMADGFAANAIYFKLGFLDKNAVALGRQFKELLGVLWMKAGAIGPCPSLAKNATIPDMMILPENKMAILINDVEYATFKQEIQEHPEIETVYIITDSDRGYREMITGLDVDHTYQLYRDYLDNFRINHRR